MPSTMETTAMMLATAITLPSMTRAERSLCARMAASAMRMPSRSGTGSS